LKFIVSARHQHFIVVITFRKTTLLKNPISFGLLYKNFNLRLTSSGVYMSFAENKQIAQKFAMKFGTKGIWKH
jgi:hypothetical protein